MYTVFVILIVIAAILMCGIVLIQNSKGGGLASGFSASNQIMGVRKTTDLLEKTTWTLAACIVVLSVASAYTMPSAHQKNSVILEETQKENKANPQTIPAFDASKVNAPATDAAVPAAVPAQEENQAE